MPTAGRLAVVAAVLLVLAAGAGLSTEPAGDGGPVSRRGAYKGGRYLIEVPARWNGGLVLYAHGFRGTLDSPLTSHLADRGYALAASSYRAEGYRVDWFVDDMRALLELFIREVRRPRWAIIHGQSMGGHVAIVSLELHPGLYQGALIECGVIDGVGVADFYLAARAAAEFLGGINLFEAPDPETLVRRVNQQWLPLMGMPPAYTERGRRFDSVLKYLIGGNSRCDFRAWRVTTCVTLYATPQTPRSSCAPRVRSMFGTESTPASASTRTSSTPRFAASCHPRARDHAA